MSGFPAAGVRAACIAIALLIVSLPHALEDFAFGEPARLDVPVVVAACALLAAYTLQLTGAVLAMTGRPWGGRIIAAVGLIWVVGALSVHGPEIHQAGMAWRLGATSIANVALMVVVGILAMWCGLRSSQAASRLA